MCVGTGKNHAGSGYSPLLCGDIGRFGGLGQRNLVSLELHARQNVSVNPKHSAVKMNRFDNRTHYYATCANTDSTCLKPFLQGDPKSFLLLKKALMMMGQKRNQLRRRQSSSVLKLHFVDDFVLEY